jgi:maleate isomerase
MRGERLRLGLLVPSSNSVMEPDFYRLLPADVALHTSRMYLIDASPAGLRHMHASLPAAADLLATVRPHLVVVGCTSLSGIDGARFEAESVARIEAQVGTPVLTIMSAVVRTLRAANVESVTVLTPHTVELDMAVQAGLEASGIAVRRVHGMGIRDNFALGEVTPEQIVDFARDTVRRLDTDALFCSCANFRAAEALPTLRALYGPWVFSSVDATLRVALEVVQGIRESGTPAAAPCTAAGG